jgi:hypothetical protein
MSARKLSMVSKMTLSGRLGPPALAAAAEGNAPAELATAGGTELAAGGAPDGGGFLSHAQSANESSQIGADFRVTGRN